MLGFFILATTYARTLELFGWAQSEINLAAIFRYLCDQELSL